MSQQETTVAVLRTYLLPGQAFSIHELMQALNAERTPIPKPNLYAILSKLKSEGVIAKKDKETYIYLGPNGVKTGESVPVVTNRIPDSEPQPVSPAYSDTLLFDGTQKVRTYEDGRVFVGQRVYPLEEDSFFETNEDGTLWQFDGLAVLTKGDETVE